MRVTPMSSVILPPLGTLASLPLLELMRHLFVLSYGRCITDQSNPSLTPTRNVIVMAMSSVVVLLIINDIANVKNKT